VSVATKATLMMAAALALCPSTIAVAAESGVMGRFAADSLDDGPYIYWQSPNHAIVFHFCDGEVIERSFETRDTLRFNGFCSDSTWEYVVPTLPRLIEPHIFERVPKIFAVSDIHGEYEALVALLTAAGVIDGESHWSWGDGHLVIDGDTFDRGDKVTECLWLFYRLEAEARATGGRVHFLLGNHETMVLRRDLRYLNQKYAGRILRGTRVNYTDLVGPDMELGRWLRTKHTAVRLNDVLFVHGGMPPLLAERGVSLAEINRLARETVDLPSNVIAFAEGLRKYYGHTDEGPFWYRGYHGAQEGRYPQATSEDVDRTLAFYGARTVVVGHSEIEQVMSLYEGKVIGLDVPVGRLGGLQGLLWENDRFFRVRSDGGLEALLGGDEEGR
jgi:hypothetical protein